MSWGGAALFLWSARPPSFLSQAQGGTDPPPVGEPAHLGLALGSRRTCAETAAPPSSAPRRGVGLNKGLMRPDPQLLSLLTVSLGFGGDPITILPFSGSGTI